LQSCLDRSLKVQANTAKNKVISYDRLPEKEQALSAVFDGLIEKAKRSDQDEDQACQ
jgi:hypothetical protein